MCGGGRQVLPSNQVDTSLEKLCILHSLTCSQPPYILLQIVNTFSGSYSGVECAADSVLSDVAIKLGLGGITDGAAPWEAYIHVKNCLHILYTRYMTIYFPVGNSMTNTWNTRCMGTDGLFRTNHFSKVFTFKITPGCRRLVLVACEQSVIMVGWLHRIAAWARSSSTSSVYSSSRAYFIWFSLFRMHQIPFLQHQTWRSIRYTVLKYFQLLWNQKTSALLYSLVHLISSTP